MVAACNEPRPASVSAWQSLALLTPQLIHPRPGPLLAQEAHPPPPQSSECLDAWLRGHIPAPVSGRPGALGPCSSRQTCVRTSSHTTAAGQGPAGPLTPDPSPPSLADTALCPPRAGPSLSYGHQAGVLSRSRELPEFKESCFFSRTRLCG